MKGFTLLEVLISVTITAIVMGAIYGAYTSNLDAIQSARRSGLVNQTARIILDRMCRDFESAFITAPPASGSEVTPRTGLLGEDREIDGRPADGVDFTSLSHLPLRKIDLHTDFCEIGYHLEEDEKEGDLIIYRRDQAIPDQDLSGGGLITELSGMVGGLDISYQDREGEDFDTWDTFEGYHKDVLPSLVRIVLTIKDLQGGAHIFTTSVHPALGGMEPQGQEQENE